MVTIQLILPLHHRRTVKCFVSFLPLITITKKGESCWLPYPESMEKSFQHVCICSLFLALICQQQTVHIPYLWSHVMRLLSLSLLVALSHTLLLSCVISFFCLFTEWLRWGPFCRFRRGKEEGRGLCTPVGAGMRKWPTQSRHADGKLWD